MIDQQTEQTPKAMRLHIGFLGRTNVGKSSFMNMLAGQDVAITSPQAGTTTDVVEKTMELLPLGPVVLMDTAGIDDETALGQARIEKTKKALRRMDVLVIVTTPGAWGTYEDTLVNIAHEHKIPVIVVINKADLGEAPPTFLALMEMKKLPWIQGSSTVPATMETFRAEFKERLRDVLPQNFTAPKTLMGDLCPAGGLVVLVVPIDLGAPKGRLIVPQVQAIRDLLDNDVAALVVKDREYAAILSRLNRMPDLVVCDSQVVARTVADTPESVPLTTFSILFARLKGDLIAQAKGAAAIENLKDGDKVLMAEGCSHHPLEDDIGRVKIPRWLRQYTGRNLTIDSSAGHDFPDNLPEYKLVIHCGGCVMTPQEMATRLRISNEHGVAITNYGVAISALQGVLKRALSPFPAALAAYEKARRDAH
ncbi:MAG: [FeFe] hydrogenase H-cluster maturation GTPase HydF [Alphaproteobacteria bacterium]|nr:[FeFe] hydrogenase H-cluster maturation GTPase HydF [Alphaproteobacteria bacterium]